MRAIAMLCMGIQVAVSLAVGMRLLSLARRTRHFPEMALSLGSLVLPAIGYPALLVAVALEGLGLPGAPPVFFVGLSFTAAAVSMNYFFTWQVFRPGVAWSVILCCVGTWLLVAPVGGVVAHVSTLGIDAGIRSARSWTLAVVFSALASYGWAALESGLYYRMARRRLRLGLVDADVCNRFLLWAVALGAFFALAGLSAGQLVLGLNPIESRLFSVSLGFAGLLNSVAMALCFMPPAGYRAWLARRAVAAQGA